MSKTNPWLSIWTSPRSAIASVIKGNANQGLWILAWVYGFLSLLNAFQALDLGHAISLVPIVFLAAIFAPLWGIAIFSIWGGLVLLVGKLLKGNASFKEVRAAYAWSCVPLIASIVIWAILLAIFGLSLFQNTLNNAPMPNSQVVILFALLIGKVVFAIWSLVIFINALAEVQGFSVLRSIGNILLAWVLAAFLIGVLWWGLSAVQVAGAQHMQLFFSLWQI